jgi:DNA-binding MarR family transcriptional regulator
MTESQSRLTTLPDLAILLAASYRVVAERLLAAMGEAGIRGMRPLYGFVIRAVAAESLTINALAERLDVTKQAASTLAEAMVRAGFLLRRGDPADRRRAVLSLSAKGRAVQDVAQHTSASMERELRARLGDADVVALRRALMSFVARHGGLTDVLARRAKPVI